MISPDKGLYIERETFNTVIAPKIKHWLTKEELPKTNGTLSIQPRVLKHYRAIDKKATMIGITRNRRLYLGTKIQSEFLTPQAFVTVDIPNDQLAPYQHCVVNKIIKSLGPDYGEALLQMDTGMGKTRVACYLINNYCMKSAVVVPTKHIANQWVEEFKKLAPSLNTNLYTNKQGEEPMGDVVIIIINTACKKSGMFFSQFGLTIFDEAHELTSTTRKNVLWAASGCRYLLGLTATPQNTGFGLLPYLESHLGKVIYAKELDGFEASVKKFKVSVKVDNYEANNTEYTEPLLNKVGVINTMGTIGNMIRDPNRNKRIVTHIEDLYKRGHNILVFAEHREHVDDIKKELLQDSRVVSPSDLLIEDTSTTILKGGATPETIKQAYSSRVIITTYSYSRRGIDYSHLDALVLATPRKTGLEQIVGRILRYSGNEQKERIIIDIVDIQTVFRSQFKERKKIYINKGWC